MECHLLYRYSDMKNANYAAHVHALYIQKLLARGQGILESVDSVSRDGPNVTYSLYASQLSTGKSKWALVVNVE